MTKKNKKKLENSRKHIIYATLINTTITLCTQIFLIHATLITRYPMQSLLNDCRRHTVTHVAFLATPGDSEVSTILVEGWAFNIFATLL